LVWTSDLNFLRFCSAFMAGEQEGFTRPVFFTGEETNDMVSVPPNPAWPATGATRQAGYVVAVDARNNKRYVIPGMGRMNHENTIIIPGGWNQVVAVTDDDTFSAPAAQLYMYLAATPQDLLDDKGQLYAFVSDDPAINDYGDVTTGLSLGGHFIAVPREIATGDQTGLENWSNANNVFQFIRTEDMAYDKNNPRILYIADTGEPRALPDPATGRLSRGPSSARGPYPNGRIFKMALNAEDPLRVDSLQILIDADAAGYNNLEALHNPDNLDTSGGSLMIQEDPISVNNFDPGAGPNARIWRYDLTNGALSVVAEVNQSLDPKARAGNWESSGIVNAASVFGPGSWLVTIQAHSLWVETAQAEGYTRKLEGGQLVLLRVPGS
jgi:secreted PhoX family phosphatase